MPEKIYIGVSRCSSFTSWIIRQGTNSPWSHAFIEYESMLWGGRWVAHAVGSGVQKVPASVALAGSTYQLYEVCFDITPGLRADARYIGRAYDWLGLLGHAWRVIASWFVGDWIRKNKLGKRNKVVCSEFVARILKDAKVPGTEEWDPEIITAGDLDVFCSLSPVLFKPVAGMIPR